MVLMTAVGCPADDGGNDGGNDGLADTGSGGATSTGQPGDDDGMSSGRDTGEDAGQTTGDAGNTTGEVETTGRDPVVCALADTEQECANAVSATDEGCVWFPHYAVTTRDGTVCEFEPAGGSCSPPLMGDTDCGSHMAACDLQIHALPGDDGMFTIARTDDGCTYLPNLPRVDCDDLDAGGEPGFDAIACACGCSADYPE